MDLYMSMKNAIENKDSETIRTLLDKTSFNEDGYTMAIQFIDDVELLKKVFDGIVIPDDKKEKITRFFPTNNVGKLKYMLEYLKIPYKKSFENLFSETLEENDMETMKYIIFFYLTNISKNFTYKDFYYNINSHNNETTKYIKNIFGVDEDNDNTIEQYKAYFYTNMEKIICSPNSDTENVYKYSGKLFRSFQDDTYGILDVKTNKTYCFSLEKEKKYWSDKNKIYEGFRVKNKLEHLKEKEYCESENSDKIDCEKYFTNLSIAPELFFVIFNTKIIEKSKTNFFLIIPTNYKFYNKKLSENGNIIHIIVPVYKEIKYPNAIVKKENYDFQLEWNKKIMLVPIDLIYKDIWNDYKFKENFEIISKTKTVRPINVYGDPRNDVVEINDGIHRTASCKKLGYTYIPAYVKQSIMSEENISQYFLEYPFDEIIFEKD